MSGAEWGGAQWAEGRWGDAEESPGQYRVAQFFGEADYTVCVQDLADAVDNFQEILSTPIGETP